MKYEYALYKGDELLSIGTAKQIAADLKVLPATIMFYGTKTYQRRLEKRKTVRNARILVKLED